MNWLRRADPAFYHKEPYLLRTQAQIVTYGDDAKAEVRLSVLTADPVMHAAAALVALCAYAAATGAGALDPRRDWPAIWALAVLAVAAPRALPFWRRPAGWAYFRQALIGSALVAIPAMWTHDAADLVIALLTGATLYAARGRGRVALLVAAAGVLFGAPMLARSYVAAALTGVFAAGAGVLGVTAIAPVWRLRPQVLMWAAFATLLVACAYAFVFDVAAVAPRIPAAIAAIGVAYLGVCIMAGRIRRAERMASPIGALSIPQSIVPLLDRSQHHAIICWLA